MLREEHNAYYKVDRKPSEEVQCWAHGYGELSHYDSRCTRCYLGHSHTWQAHDDSIRGSLQRRADWRARITAAIEAIAVGETQSILYCLVTCVASGQYRTSWATIPTGNASEIAQAITSRDD